MSLTTLHSPKLSLTSSFGSNFNLAEHLDESDLRRIYSNSSKFPNQQRAHPLNENSPLISTNGDDISVTINGDAADAIRTLQQKERISFSLLATVVIVTLGSSFQFGYATGVLNNSQSFMTNYFRKRGVDYTQVDWSVTVSCYGIGGLLGSFIGPKVFRCGRRATLIYNNIFLFISSYLIIMAQAWWWQAIGRIFVGIVAGIATAVVPMYFSELSPISIRGTIGTMHQLGITIGIVTSQWLSTPSLNIFGSEEEWQNLFFVPAVFGAIECMFLPCCPESPSYLYRTEGRQSARESLQRLQPDMVDVYLDLIEEEINANSKSTLSTWELLCSTELKKQLIVGIVVQLMMQFSGIDALFYYSTEIFYQAEVADPELATTLLGIVNVLVTLFAAKYMDSAGRKRLLTISWIGLFISYALLTMSFVLKPLFDDCMDKVSVVATTGVIIFFAFGPGCIAWFLIAEMFPLSARDTAMAIGILINWAANWLVAFSFPHILQYTQPYTFLIFAGTSAFFLHFTINYVPETKGLTVAQIAKEFDSISIGCCSCQ